MNILVLGETKYLVKNQKLLNTRKFSKNMEMLDKYVETNGIM